MRKAKVAAALLCVLTPGILGGLRIDTTYSVTNRSELRDQVVRLTESAPAAASLMADTIVMSIRKPVTTAASQATAAPETETETTPEQTPDETLEITMTTKPAETSAAVTETAASSCSSVILAAAVTTQPAVTTTRTTVTTVTASAAGQTETTQPDDASEETTAAAEASVFSSLTTVTTAATTVSTTTSTAAQPKRPITDAEYIMLCNVVGNEYGAYWISEYDKALVVEVIMNRVNSPQFPNTIYGVLMQKGQFTGLESRINLGRFSSQVTDSVKAAVDLYFADPSRFNHGYLFYTGDGKRNYFRTKY